MPSGRVLVIEDDEAVLRLLATCLRKVGYEVHTAADAAAGFGAAQRTEPDCIVCDINLPGADGFWVARQVRDERGRLATTPFLFLTAMDDERSRLAGFEVGADVYMTKPFRIGEVVAQIGALVQMAKRVQARQTATPPPGRAMSDPGVRVALSGDLGQMALPSVLTVLDLERRSGKLVVKADGHRAELDLARGCPTRAGVDGADSPVVAVMREILRWQTGTFDFRPGEPPPVGDAPRPTLGALLLESMRLDDEDARDEAREERRSRLTPTPDDPELSFLDDAPAADGADPEATPLMPEATLAALELEVEVDTTSLAPPPPESDPAPVSWADVIEVEVPAGER